jgi:hypothetical protein
MNEAFSFILNVYFDATRLSEGERHYKKLVTLVSQKKKAQNISCAFDSIYYMRLVFLAKVCYLFFQLKFFRNIFDYFSC